MNRIVAAILLGLGSIALAIMDQGSNSPWLYLLVLGQITAGLVILAAEWIPALEERLNREVYVQTGSDGQGSRPEPDRAPERSGADGLPSKSKQGG